MAIGMFQKAVLYLKEIQDIGLFGVMINSRWFAAFSGSPLYFVMLPFIGVLLTILAGINGYQFATTNNKNFDKLLALIVSLICAACASVSLYGAVIATAMGVSFAAGPWFFLASVILAGLHQSVMFGLNLYRAYESRKEPVQHMHYLQAVLSNLFIFSLLSVIAGSVIFVMLTPVAPVVGSAFAIAAVALTAVTMIWQLTPYNWKQAIKEFLHLGKTEIAEQPLPNRAKLADTPDSELMHKSSHCRLFSQPDYSAQIKVMNLSEAEAYLEGVIVRKIAVLHSNSLPLSEKNQQKADLLMQLSTSLKSKEAISKGSFSEHFPFAFQSFWSEKGEVEQICDAVIVLNRKQQENVASVFNDEIARLQAY